MAKLSPEDQQRVDSVVNTAHNASPRAGFKPLMLLTVILLVLAAITLVCYIIAARHNFI